MGIVKGKKLMLFISTSDGGYRSIGYCTNHTFSSSASTVDVSHKDVADSLGAGRWEDQDVDVLSWSITSESFYANEANGYTADDIFEMYANSTVLNVKFGLADNSTTGAPNDGWTPKASSKMFSGSAVITSFDVNAAVSDNATMSITLTGKGAVKLEA